MKKVYLAGPDVFLPNAKELGRVLQNKLSDIDLEGLFPLDNEITFHGTAFHIGKKIAESNRNMILQCDIVLANLEPFRGPSADVGTVWECAFAKGLGKTVIGYNVPTTKYQERVIGHIPHDGMTVEQFNVFDNIMLAHGLDSQHASLSDAIYYLQNLTSKK